MISGTIVDTIVDPYDTTQNTVYCLASDGLWKTTNWKTAGRASWAKVLDIRHRTLGFVAAKAAEFKRVKATIAQKDRIYVMGYAETTAGGGAYTQYLWRTDNGGVNWTRTATGCTATVSTMNGVLEAGQHNAAIVYVSDSVGTISKSTFDFSESDYGWTPFAWHCASPWYDASATYNSASGGFTMSVTAQDSTASGAYALASFDCTADHVIVSGEKIYIDETFKSFTGMSGRTRVDLRLTLYDAINGTTIWTSTDLDDSHAFMHSHDTAAAPISDTFYGTIGVSGNNGKTVKKIEIIYNAWGSSGLSQQTNLLRSTTLPWAEDIPGTGKIRKSTNSGASFADYIVGYGAHDLECHYAGNATDADLTFWSTTGNLYRTAGATPGAAIDTEATANNQHGRIVTHVFDSDVIYTLNGTGADTYKIRRTVTGGSSWSDGATGLASGRCIGLAPTTSNTTPASQGLVVGDDGHIYSSVDGGDTLADRTGDWAALGTTVRIVPMWLS